MLTFVCLSIWKWEKKTLIKRVIIIFYVSIIFKIKFRFILQTELESNFLVTLKFLVLRSVFRAKIINYKYLSVFAARLSAFSKYNISVYALYTFSLTIYSIAPLAFGWSGIWHDNSISYYTYSFVWDLYQKQKFYLWDVAVVKSQDTYR